jgi:hypothetical protein
MSMERTYMFGDDLDSRLHIMFERLKGGKFEVLRKNNIIIIRIILYLCLN